MSEEFNLGGWFADGIKGVRSTLHIPRVNVIPEEFHSHMKQSRKEFLLAFRSLFDAAIDSADKPKGPRKATKIKVE